MHCTGHHAVQQLPRLDAPLVGVDVRVGVQGNWHRGRDLPVGIDAVKIVGGHEGNGIS